MKLPANEDVQTRGEAPFYVDEKAVNDYYPFGMLIANDGSDNRSWQAGNYRYVYNGQERSLEIDPNGNHNTAEFWEYDARSGRRWNLDPVVKPWHSGYSTFSDNPIANNDIKGDEDVTQVKPPPTTSAESAKNQEDMKKLQDDMNKLVTSYNQTRQENPRSFLFGEGIAQAFGGGVQATAGLGMSETTVGAVWGVTMITSGVYSMFAGGTRALTALVGSDNDVKNMPSLLGNSLPGMVVGATTGSQTAANYTDVGFMAGTLNYSLTKFANMNGYELTDIIANDLAGKLGYVANITDAYSISTSYIPNNIPNDMNNFFNANLQTGQITMTLPKSNEISGEIVAKTIPNVPMVVKIEPAPTTGQTNSSQNSQKSTQSIHQSGVKPTCKHGG